MKKKIIGVTVGTPIKPQAVIDKSNISKELEKNIGTALDEAKKSGKFDGADGVSPTIKITPIEGGHRVTITDVNGVDNFDVMNGVDTTEDLDEEITEQDSLIEQIKAALLGKMSAVGISSIEKTYTEGLVDTYTITFTDGSKSTFTVTNGADGKDGQDGANGADGKDGEDGVDGKDGTDGKSAYEYAKDGGYTGTEAKFAEKLAAEWQLKTDESLKTTNKTVIGAINEVSGKTADKLGKIYLARTATAYATPIGAGIMYGNTYETDLGYGDVENYIPIVAGENVTFEPTTNDKDIPIVKINGQAGLDKIAEIDTWVNGAANNLYTDDGITWEECVGFFDDKGNTLADGLIYHRIPIEAGDNVTFSTEGNVVKINASGGGSSGMPQIRFVGMPCTGWFGEVDWEQINGNQLHTNENLKFTIEIVGGGALQVGDALQICRMGSYGGISGDYSIKPKPKKKKLRRLFEYVITEEDLGKRFITFEVPYSDKKAIKLFTQWATSGVNDKSIYFRIRRPKGEINSGNNGGGMTVDAEFSNVVSVRCLSYGFSWVSESGDEVYFYHIRIT